MTELSTEQALEAVRQAAANREASQHELAQAVRNAHAIPWISYARIAEYSGLSRQRIAQIVRGGKQ